MFYVVAYDLPDNKRRSRVFKIMKGYGIHTQYSLFECELSDRELEIMTRKLQKVIDKSEDDIKIYPLCKSCVEKVECHGKAVLNTEEEVIVI